MKISAVMKSIHKITNLLVTCLKKLEQVKYLTLRIMLAVLLRTSFS